MKKNEKIVLLGDGTTSLIC